LILAVMIAAMIRLDINHRRRIKRRREAWKAEGANGSCPGDGHYSGTGFYSAGGFGSPGGGGLGGANCDAEKDGLGSVRLTNRDAVDTTSRGP
jgi:hypothetical protein